MTLSSCEILVIFLIMDFFFCINFDVLKSVLALVTELLGALFNFALVPPWFQLLKQHLCKCGHGHWRRALDAWGNFQTLFCGLWKDL